MKEKKPKEHFKSAAEVLKFIDKEYGEGIIINTENKEESREIEWMPSGSIAVDKAIGKGIPKGRIIEMFGLESGGKSSLVLIAIAAAQKLGETCVYIDTEGSYSPAWAKRMGVDTEKLIAVQPNSAEEALDIVEKFVTSNSCAIVVVDSVAGLVPKAEVEGNIGDVTVGLQARLMSSALRKLTMLIHKTKTTVIFINQLRQKIGVMYGSNEVTPGGTALKYYASVRLRVSRISKSETVDELGVTNGHRMHVTVPKNKVSAPFSDIEFMIKYDKGPENIEAICGLAVDRKIIEQSGPSYKLNINGTEQKFFGQEKLQEAIITDPVLLKYLIDKLELSDFYAKALLRPKA